uniref:Uncharacterized protein n=1 Tax=Arundo donax TaxID=35708 RepID=A0A0A9MS96_ARUDO
MKFDNPHELTKKTHTYNEKIKYIYLCS